MDMVIIKGSFNDRYVNNATYIAFIIQDILINAIIEVSAWRILETCLLSGKPLILSATLLRRYSYMIFLFIRKGIGLKFVHVPFSNCNERGFQTLESYQKVFNLVYMIVLWRMSSFLSWDFTPIFFNSGSPLAFTPLFSNMIIPLSSVWSNMLDPSLICSNMISLLVLWSACSDMLGSAHSDLLCLLFLCTF